MGPSQAETEKAGSYAAAEENVTFLEAEAAGEGEDPDEGASSVSAEYSLDYEVSEATEVGYF